jgi:hypothetical protein
MDIEQLIGFGLVVTLAEAMIFYTMGVNAGKKIGYLKGRKAGINISKRAGRQS